MALVGFLLAPSVLAKSARHFELTDSKARGGGVNSSICCLDDLGHRDVTMSEAHDFADFSKMAQANLLDTRSTNLFFVLVRLSAVLARFYAEPILLFL